MTMTKCKNPSCDKEVVSIEGRRPKEYCSAECRTIFNNSKKKKEGSKRGRPAGSKNKANVIVSVDPIKVDGDNLTVMTVTKGILEGGEPIAFYHSVKDPVINTNEMANKIAEHYSVPVIKEVLDELVTFGTATIKTELIEGEVSQKIVDKKKIVNEESEWKPKLSPFMLARQKAKGGGK